MITIIWRLIPLSLIIWYAIYLLFGWRGIIVTLTIGAGLFMRELLD